MKKTLIVALFALGIIAFAPPVKADSWSNLYIVNKETHSSLYDPYAIEDARGHKWVQINGCNKEGSTSYTCVYEYDGQNWTDHTSTIEGLTASGHLLDNGTIFADNQENIWQIALPSLPVGHGSYRLLQYDGTNWHLLNAVDRWSQVLGTTVTGFDTSNLFDMFGDNQGNIYTVESINCDQINHHQSISVLKRDVNGNWSTAVPQGNILNTTDAPNGLHGKYNNVTGDFWFYFKPFYDQPPGLEKGVYRYHNGSWTNYTTANGLASNIVKDMLIDRSGNVWATSSNGVSRFDGSTWSIWNTSNSNLTSNEIRQISEDSKGRLWFTTAKDANSTYADSGISVFDPANNSWIYFTDKDGDNNLTNVSKTFHFGDDAWISTGDWSQGFVVYNLNDTQTTIYGQTSGDLVTKSGFDMAKKKKKTKTVNSKAVTIYKLTRVKVKKKYKTRKTLVYKTGATQWYKALNLDTGQYKIISKAKGKKKHTKTINITNGNPYRLDLRY